MKAIVTCSNDVNNFNNEVQSNITYVSYKPITGGSKTAFLVSNPTEEKIPLKLHINSSLPDGWRTYTLEDTSQIGLDPGEESTLHLVIEMSSEADKKLEPPFDGSIKGEMWGSFSGSFSGILTETIWNGINIQGRFTCNLDYIGIITGGFNGSLDVHTGQIEGLVSGTLQGADSKASLGDRISIRVSAHLKPVRSVDISQFVNGKAIGGISIQVQVPAPIHTRLDSFLHDQLTPTDSFVV